MLSRFASWMNGFTFIQIQIHSKYSATDFDDDLRNALVRSGCQGEKICFALDEGDVVDVAMLERMNTLLANAEVPGLFEGEEFNALIASARESAFARGVTLQSVDDVYQWFRRQIMINLHVVFTMNPPSSGVSLQDKLTTSPALFNRCIINWMGDWAQSSLRHVAEELTGSMDLDDSNGFKSSSPTNEQKSVRETIPEAMEFIHNSVKNATHLLVKQQNASVFITPQHFLELNRQFGLILREKREGYEEHQRHVIRGLEKIEETLLKVEEMRSDLSIKETALSRKTAQANDKLKTMMKDQQEAELNQAESLVLQTEISQQEKSIESRKSMVMTELAQVEPLVAEAQKCVSSIKRQHLQELRTMQSPPEAVKLTMESVCILLGHKIESWRTVQSVSRKDDFIANITNYNTVNLSPKIRDEIETSYMNHPSFNFETVNRASKACGPLLQWVVAQVRYCSILEKVSPLRQEVEELEVSATLAREKARDITISLESLETRIAQYREEYALLIAESQALKTEMESVKDRVERSIRLIQNLSSEKARWETSR